MPRNLEDKYIIDNLEYRILDKRPSFAKALEGKEKSSPFESWILCPILVCMLIESLPIPGEMPRDLLREAERQFGSDPLAAS